MRSLPGPLRLAPPFPFVGRTRELGALRALVPRAVGEGGRAALLAGEPGSGKSRLVRELAQEASGDGATVLYGACDPAVRTPYRPFVEALDYLIRGMEIDELRADLGPLGGELTRLLPHLDTLVGDLPVPVPADPDTGRHRLHVAVIGFLSAVSRRSPILLVLEDVHWADAPSLLLLQQLVRSGGEVRMLLLATFRDADADVPAELSEALVDVRRTDGVVRLRLGGLEADEVAALVEGAAGAVPRPELTAAFEELTNGNPFLITELWRELVDTDAVSFRGGVVTLSKPLTALGTPEGVREVVSQRLARLGPATNELLDLAAVVGPEFELALVRLAAALPEATLLDAVDEGLRSGMLVEVPARRLAYRFAHELVRRALSDRPSSPRRAELHFRVAEALVEGAGELDERARVAALAHHFAAAAPLGGVDRAVTYNLRAARAAVEALAFDEAVERFDTALALGVADEEQRGRALLDMGSAYHRAGRAIDAVAAFREASDLARASGDPDLLALAAIGFEEACWRPGIVDEGAAELLEEAVAANDGESQARVRLLGGLARALDFRGEFTKAALARNEAIRLARSRDDRAALGWVLAAAYWSRGVSSREEIDTMLREAAEIGSEIGDAELRAEALSWLIPSRCGLGDHVGARATLELLFEAARQINEPFRFHVAEHYTSALELCDGDLRKAEASAIRSREWSRLLTGRDASGVYGIQMFGIRREQGRLAELAPVIRMLAVDDGTSWGPGLVAVLAELGMDVEARRELRRITNNGLDHLRPSLWLASLVYLADACFALGDEECAALVYPEIERYHGSNVVIGHLVSCYGSADRYLGILASVLGEWDVAEAHFESALTLNRSLGARTWAAHTSFAYARMLLTRKRGNDLARASTLLGQAAALADSIGLVALNSRIAALGRAVGPAPGPELPDGLSAREVDILRLVASGRSNREVGAELHISEHTVANHVRSILRKTACANRTEAAAYAHRTGLVKT
jgi:DNA-binding CsgD family transcriptional regulator/tetratricopeptide (TPR) repeat protein